MTSLEEATLVADQLRQRIEAAERDKPDDCVPVTVSQINGYYAYIEIGELVVYDGQNADGPPTVEGCLESLREQLGPYLRVLPKSAPKPPPPKSAERVEKFLLKAPGEAAARVVSVGDQHGHDLVADLGPGAYVAVARVPAAWLVKVRSPGLRVDSTIPDTPGSA